MGGGGWSWRLSEVGMGGWVGVETGVEVEVGVTVIRGCVDIDSNQSESLHVIHIDENHIVDGDPPCSMAKYITPNAHISTGFPLTSLVFPSSLR